MSREPSKPNRPPMAELGQEISSHTLLLHEAVADRLGLGRSDHKCLSLLIRNSPDATMSAGQLAELTGLTTGAITGVLDRLERGGFIRREKDPDDRRQVLARVLPDRLDEIGRLFDPLQRAMEKLETKYTAAEMALVQRYMGEVLEAMRAVTEQLRDKGAPAPAELASGLVAALGDVERGNLTLRNGASRLRLVETSEAVLYRAQFEGKAPELKSRDGNLVVEYERASRRSGGSLALSNRVPWSIRLRDGASQIDADLRRLEIEALEIDGGASEITLRLPPPRTTVTVRVSGGVERLTILRPADTAARLQVRGGASRLTIETFRLGDVGGVMRWASPDYERVKERYDIEITGGAENLTLAVA